jgi:hypothetical protein
MYVCEQEALHILQGLMVVHLHTVFQHMFDCGRILPHTMAAGHREKSGGEDRVQVYSSSLSLFLA